MMQTEVPCAAAAADPAACDSFFRSPPGLQLSEAAESSQLAAFARVEQILGDLCNSQEREEVVEALREAVLSKVEALVATKAQELWARARQAVSQLQEKHREDTGKLLEEVARCHERQQALQVENDTLKQGIQTLSERFSLLSKTLGGKDLGFFDSGTSPTASPAQATPELLAPFSSPVSEVGFGSPTALDPCSAELAANAGLERLWGAGKVPELPAFPFPAQPLPPQPLPPQPLPAAVQQLPPPGTPLSLADALDADAPHQPAQCSFLEAVPPPLPGVAPLMEGDFNFMMPEAGAARDQALAASAAWPDGGAEVWGHQWSGAAMATAECKAEVGTLSKPSTLRADACVFVPWSAGSPAQQLVQPEGEAPCS